MTSNNNEVYGPFDMPKVGMRYRSNIQDTRLGRWRGGRVYCEVTGVNDRQINFQRINKAKLGLDATAKPIIVPASQWQRLVLTGDYYHIG